MTHRGARAGLVLLTTLAVACALASAGWAADDTTQGEPLRLAMSGAFQPFSTTDEQGRLVGFDADVARALARRMGRTAELVQIDWAGIQAGLQSGKFDLICGSMAITEDRLRRMHFTLPYYVSGAQVFLREGLETYRGARLGVTEDSTYAHWIAEHPEDFGDVEILTFGSEAEIVAAIRADKVDGFVSDRIVGGFYASRGTGRRIVPHGDLLYEEACGIAARKDAPTLVHSANQALLSLVQDGTYDRLYRRWVGTRPDLGILLASWGDFASRIPALAPQGTEEGAETAFADTTASMLGLLARGAWLTLQLAFLTGIVALLVGAVVAVGSVSRHPGLKYLSTAFIWIVRGTPLLVQLFLAYFVLATFVNRALGIELLGAFGAALVALIVNTTAYNAETLRGGILAVDSGQWDAAASLGMTRGKILRRIVLPQAFRSALPSLGNNLVVLIKDTSLVGAITLIELTYAARNIVFQTGQAFFPFVLAALFYLTIISAVTVGINAWERWYARSRRTLGRSV